MKFSVFWSETMSMYRTWMCHVLTQQTRNMAALLCIQLSTDCQYLLKMKLCMVRAMRTYAKHAHAVRTVKCSVVSLISCPQPCDVSSLAIVFMSAICSGPLPPTTTST